MLSIEIVFVKEVEIFPKRHCGALSVNWLQSFKLSKLEDNPIVQESNPGRTRVFRGGPVGRISFKPPTLTACNFDASQLTETHNTSLERSLNLINKPKFNWED